MNRILISTLIFALAGCVTKRTAEPPPPPSVERAFMSVSAAALPSMFSLSVQKSYHAAVIASTPYSGRASVALAWDPSPDTNAVGYRIYYGTASGSYSNSATVGNVTTATLINLDEGVLYYFVCTAYDDSGVESQFSNEVSTTTGFYVSIRPANWAVETYGRAGATNQILRSFNLSDWEVRNEFVGEAGALTTLIEPNSSNAFYRVIVKP